MTYGERLRSARERAGMTVPELAERAGVARSSIWRWETGVHVPQPRHQARIARAIGVEPTCDLPPTDTFGDRVRRAREERGWSQAQLARRIGVSQRAVASWELDRKEPFRKHRIRLMCLLGVRCVDRDEAVGAATDAILAVHRNTSREYDGLTADEILTAYAGGWDIWGDEAWGAMCREAMATAREIEPEVGKVPDKQDAA